jgi:hypothetical protein
MLSWIICPLSVGTGVLQLNVLGEERRRREDRADPRALHRIDSEHGAGFKSLLLSHEARRAPAARPAPSASSAASRPISLHVVWTVTGADVGLADWVAV